MIFIACLPISRSAATLTTFDDYQFTNDTTINAHSWTFDLTVQNPSWTITGRVLSYNFYDVNDSEPVNYISPIDILIGTGIVKDDPTQFHFNYIWTNRVVNVSFQAPDSQVQTVVSNIGNIHCIARTYDALQSIKSVVNGSILTLHGYLVDVIGSNVSGSLSWTTATQFGTSKCEILVISNTVPNGVTMNDINIMVGLGIGVVAVIVIVTYIHIKSVKGCQVKNQKRIGKLKS